MKGQPNVSRTKTAHLFAQTETAPAIGGLELFAEQNKYELPAEVVLFEPSVSDIHRGGAPASEGKPGTRLIFLNTPLTDFEQTQLKLLHEALKKEAVITKEGDANFPPYVRLHALRILQQSKWRVDKAIAVMSTHLEMRVQRLPVREDAVMQDLQQAMMYWHGRDRACRPVLVWRLEEISNFDIDRATRMILFILEYAVRYLLVPGRVENWVLIVDLNNCGWSTATSSSTRNIARNVTRLLEEVYCGRNYTTKIFHMPSLLRAIVNSVIPEDKKTKVEFVADKDIANCMRGICEPHQLEQQYGGTAPNVKKGECYPFRFFPNCRSPNSGGSPPNESLHAYTDRAFHAGFSWDLYPGAKEHWAAESQCQALTPAAATALAPLVGVAKVDPVVTLDRWLELVAPGTEKAGEDKDKEYAAKEAVVPAKPEELPPNPVKETPTNPVKEAPDAIINVATPEACNGVAELDKGPDLFALEAHTGEKLPEPVLDGEPTKKAPCWLFGCTA